MTRDELIAELERRGKSSTKALFRWAPDRLLDEWRACILAEKLRRRRHKIVIPEPPKFSEDDPILEECPRVPSES